MSGKDLNVMKYLTNLNTYKYPPDGIYPLEKLQKICEERIKLYKIFIYVDATFQNLNSNTAKWRKIVRHKIHAESLKTYQKLLRDHVNDIGAWEARKQDDQAHWILSLCYCNDLDLCDYFIKWETAWILLVYESSSEVNRKQFLKNLKYKYKQVPKQEKAQFEKELIASSEFINDIDSDATTCYKTRFENITSLVGERKIFVRQGFAYFPEENLFHLIECHFRSEFKAQLAVNARGLPSIVNSNQFRDFLDSIAIVTTKLTYSEELDVGIDNLEDVSKYHFPLCMQSIHRTLKENHHLKHDCRMQYGIFLKNLGLPYEDAMEFIAGEFMKSMPEEIFKKKYSYYFKHYYGKVGSRINYKPYTCEFIQNMTPIGPHMYHGCPFKHWDKTTVVAEIKRNRICARDLRDIEDLVSANQFRKACTKYFCVTRQVRREGDIESPNEYSAESIRIEKGLDSAFNAICNT